MTELRSGGTGVDQMLDLMILEVFSNLRDPVTLWNPLKILQAGNPQHTAAEQIIYYSKPFLLLSGFYLETDGEDNPTIINCIISATSRWKSTSFRRLWLSFLIKQLRSVVTRRIWIPLGKLPVYKDLYQCTFYSLSRKYLCFPSNEAFLQHFPRWVVKIKPRNLTTALQQPFSVKKKK